MYNYAHLLEVSDDFNDQKESLKYYKLAALKGDVPAMLRYGEKLLFGDVNMINKNEASQYCKMAVGKGEIKAMKYYATMCLNGNGIETNLIEASKYFKMAADLGDAHSMNQYAYTLLLIDRNNAVKYLKMALYNGYYESAITLSSIYYQLIKMIKVLCINTVLFY